MARGFPLRFTKSMAAMFPSLSLVILLCLKSVGHLLTSSNYDDKVKKITGGRNGYGAKLTNIFSKRFEVHTVDSKRKKGYTQVFTDNLSKT